MARCETGWRTVLTLKGIDRGIINVFCLVQIKQAVVWEPDFKAQTDGGRKAGLEAHEKMVHLLVLVKAALRDEV